MKIQKKLFVFAVLLMAASLVFAQASMTSYSTQGLFGTDVDDFMNVNEWQNVQPKNIFGFLGYGSEGVSEINLGLAHQFKAFYLGTYFEGVIPGWEKKTDTSSNTVTTQTKNANKVTNGKLLFGFGNIGILADASYTPKSGNKKTWDPDTKAKETKNKFNLDFNLKAGINLNSNNKIFKIAPRIGLNSKMDKEQTVTDGKLTSLDDKSYHDLMIGTGFYHDFSKKDAVTQTIIAELDTSWRIYPKKTGATAPDNTTSTYGRMHNEITLAPAWQIAYEPEGKFAIKAQVWMKTRFTFEKEKDYDDNSITGKTYKTSRTHTNTLTLTPSLMTGFVYTPISKFKLNFGLEFGVPSLSWKTKKIQTRNAATGDVTKTENKIDLNAYGSSGKFSASSGFTWLITENVTLDAKWDILTNLFNNNFATSFNGAGMGFWENLNQLVFHNAAFAVSVKF